MVINCKMFANEKKESLKEERVKIENKIKNNKDLHLKLPLLAVIQIGDNSASNSYIKGKRKDCEEIGFDFILYKIDYCEDKKNEKETKMLETLNLIEKLNNDENVTGIILQLPTPFCSEAEYILTHKIAIEKDIDGFINNSNYIACTPKGIIDILKSITSIEGKNVVVIGRSEIVGKPVASLLLKENATVTICHSKTKDLKFHTKHADILIVAVGKEKFLTAEMVNPNSIVIDVGINRNSQGKLCGDVDFENVASIVKAITPVPGGIGLMTRVALLENLCMAWEDAYQKKRYSKHYK